jgi:hypothetical protein
MWQSPGKIRAAFVIAAFFKGTFLAPVRFRTQGERWVAMNFIARNPYRLRAEHCSQKSDMARDAKIKKFWEDLADEWMALEDKGDTDSSEKSVQG